MASSGEYSVYRNSIDTMERAVKERVLLVKEGTTWKFPYRPSVEIFNSKTTLFTTEFNKHVVFTNPMKAEAFAMSYQARKRTILLNAVKLNEKYGFTDDSSIIKCFVKHEKYLFKEGKEVIPRLIQPRDHRYIVETGRYIKPIEKLIYKIINTMYGYTAVFKGLNMERRGELLYEMWGGFKKPVAIGLDASKFDRHVSNAALSWEHMIYQKFYRNDKFFKHLMKLQRQNQGRGRCNDGYLKYKTTHNRASGDSNTSLGNVLIMCALVYDYIHSKGLHARLANDGDDCVLIVEAEDLIKLDGISNHFKTAGFLLVTEAPVYILEEIEFCQAHPVRNHRGTYTMVRDVHKSLSKDAVALKPLDNENVKKMWMAAVGIGGMKLTSGMPILQDYYNVFKRHSGGARPLSDPTLDGGFWRLSLGMADEYITPTPETRLSFWMAFGISPQQQIECENYYKHLTLGVGYLDNRFAVLPL